MGLQVAGSLSGFAESSLGLKTLFVYRFQLKMVIIESYPESENFSPLRVQEHFRSSSPCAL